MIKESTQYDNFLSKESNKNPSIFDFVDEDENLITEEYDKEWKKHWVGMPEYVQEDKKTYKTIYVHFRNQEDYEEFERLIDQKLTKKTKSIWYPKLDRSQNALLRWIEEE